MNIFSKNTFRCVCTCPQFPVVECTIVILTFNSIVQYIIITYLLNKIMSTLSFISELFFNRVFSTIIKCPNVGWEMKDYPLHSVFPPVIGLVSFSGPVRCVSVDRISSRRGRWILIYSRGLMFSCCVHTKKSVRMQFSGFIKINRVNMCGRSRPCLITLSLAWVK